MKICIMLVIIILVGLMFYFMSTHTDTVSLLVNTTDITDKIKYSDKLFSLVLSVMISALLAGVIMGWFSIYTFFK